MHLARVLSFKLVYRLSVFLLLFLAVFSLYFSPNQAYEDHCLWLLTEKKKKKKRKAKNNYRIPCFPVRNLAQIFYGSSPPCRLQGQVFSVSAREEFSHLVITFFKIREK